MCSRKRRRLPPRVSKTRGATCATGACWSVAIPYDTAGCEHFGVGTLQNPSASVYRWMKEDPTTPGSLIAQGSPVTIPAPVWTVNPGCAPPVVVAVIPVPPPPAVVPVPYLPNAEFGVAVWAKVFETESPNKAELDHLVADDAAVPGHLGGAPDPNPVVTEIEWQILQTDAMNPTANELTSSKQMGNGNESVTRRYEFYKYVGPYEINTSDGANTGTNEALCASVGADGVHGGVGSVVIYDANGNPQTIDCSTTTVVGEYIGAQNAAADVATPLSANGANLVDGEVGVRYPDRPLIFGGSGGPYSITFSGGTLPATNAGNEFTLDSTHGRAQRWYSKRDGHLDVYRSCHRFGGSIAAGGGCHVQHHRCRCGDGRQHRHTGWRHERADVRESHGLRRRNSIPVDRGGRQCRSTGFCVRNTLSLTANDSGAFDVQVTVDDSLGGTNTKTLTYNVAAVGLRNEHTGTTNQYAGTANQHAVPPTNTPIPPTSTPDRQPAHRYRQPAHRYRRPHARATDQHTDSAHQHTGTADQHTVSPTNTPVPPTDTPVPPTSTPVPPTNTPVPQLGLSISKAGNGAGTVTSLPAGIACGATCSGQFDQNSSVTLTEAPTAGSFFGGWGGACTGTNTTTNRYAQRGGHLLCDVPPPLGERRSRRLGDAVAAGGPAGRRVRYSVNVQNQGPARAIAATLSVTFAGLQSADVGTIKAPKGCSVSGAVVTCPLGDLKPRKKIQKTISVKPSVAGTIDVV